MNPYALQLYIDGSCQKNPGGPGGIAGVITIPDDNTIPSTIFQIGYKETTNNRMELRAIIKALEYIKNNIQKLKNININQVEIWSDSENAIKGYYNCEAWRTNKWLSKDNYSIKNVDLLAKIITLKNSVKFSYKISYIINKSTTETVLVDKLAKQVAKGTILIIDDGYIKQKVSKTTIKGPTEKFKAQGQHIIIRVFEHGIINHKKNTLYKVKFEIMSETLNKYYAYTTQNIDEMLDRWHFYNAQFNYNPKNPIIVQVKEVDQSNFIFS